ncbi:MAG: right-handed parallel beta-helix repeat-containing protein, partial [Oscillospiraceae bacterium]
QIFISNDGKDSNSGTIEAPLKTFEAAFQKVAKLKNRDGGVIIYIRGGIYSVEEGLKIPDYISGDEKNPVIISAYKDEYVELSGGISVEGKDFKIADDAIAIKKIPKNALGSVYSVDLKKMGYEKFPKVTTSGEPKLTVDGTEYTLARWPNASNVKYAKYEGEDGKNGVLDIGPVTNAIGGNPITGDTGAGFEFQLLDPRPFGWENTGDIWMYGAFDAEYLVKYYHIRNFNEQKKSIRTYTHAEMGANYNAHNSYYYLNVLEELDIPGEWFLDYETGMLYIYPISDISNSRISIPVTNSDLIQFSTQAHNIVLNGLTVSDGLAKGITLSGYQNIIQNCKIERTTASAVNLHKSKNCGVINSTIIGGSVSITDNATYNTSNCDSQDLRPTRNFVQNNSVINASISVRYGVQNIISHNSVQNASSMCIYVAKTQESIFEYNEVVGGPHRTVDSGMIYFEGAVDNIYNHVRYNYFHDSTLQIRNDPFGVYFDDLTSNNFAYGNILREGNMFMHGGSNNVFYNNLIIDQTTSEAIRNSSNFYKGSMSGVFVDGYIKSGGYRVAFDYNGKYKSTQITWKNRYPTVFEWMKTLQKVRVLRLQPSYVPGDFEKNWVAPQNNVYKNNLLYNCTNIGGNVFGERNSWWDDNYKISKDEEIFEDYKNKNYNIKPESDTLKNIKTFEPLPPQEKIGITNGVKQQELNKMYPISPINNLNYGVFTNSLAFKWSPSIGATYYNLVLSTDPNFENIIGEYQTKYNYYILTDELEIDTVYYWKVSAVSLCQSYDVKEIVMDTAKFKTFTYEEAAANTVIDLSEYEAEIEKIKETTDLFHEENGADIGVGTYKKGTKELVNNLIVKSSERVKKYALQKEIINEISETKDEFYKIITENAIPYVRKYNSISLEDWDNFAKDNSKITLDNNILTLSTEKGCSIAHDTRILTPKEHVLVKMNFGDMNEWDAFSIKQTVTDNKNIVVSAQGYYIIVKKDVLELQRYPSVGGAIKDTVQNTDIIRPNQWHDIETGCDLTEEGMKVTVKVDGAVIFDYLDTKTAIKDLGYFSFQSNRGANSGVSIKGN